MEGSWIEVPLRGSWAYGGIRGTGPHSRHVVPSDFILVLEVVFLSSKTTHYLFFHSTAAVVRFSWRGPGVCVGDGTWPPEFHLVRRVMCACADRFHFGGSGWGCVMPYCLDFPFFMQKNSDQSSLSSTVSLTQSLPKSICFTLEVFCIKNIYFRQLA